MKGKIVKYLSFKGSLYGLPLFFLTLILSLLVISPHTWAQQDAWYPTSVITGEEGQSLVEKLDSSDGTMRRIRIYDSQGSLRNEFEYTLDKISSSRNYHPNGSLKNESLYEDEKLKEKAFYDSKGKLMYREQAFVDMETSADVEIDFADSALMRKLFAVLKNQEKAQDRGELEEMLSFYSQRMREEKRLKLKSRYGSMRDAADRFKQDDPLKTTFSYISPVDGHVSQNNKLAQLVVEGEVVNKYSNAVIAKTCKISFVKENAQWRIDNSACPSD